MSAAKTSARRKSSSTKRSAAARRRKPPVLAFHADRSDPFERLPFVGQRSIPRRNFPYWGVPASGGYFGGCHAGQAMAYLYLRYARAHGRVEDVPTLGLMLLDWLDQALIRAGRDELVARRPPWLEAMRGQLVGFAQVLSSWGGDAARFMGAPLDNLSDARLLELLNAGVQFDEPAYLRHLDAGVLFEAADVLSKSQRANAAPVGGRVVEG